MLKFKSVKELRKESWQIAKDCPNWVDFLVYGSSVKGNELYCLKIGKGKINVLILGFPHSNEPFGGTFSIYYAKKLASDEDNLDKFTFWIIPCADPDSALLNEEWFTKNYSFLNEVIYNYRNKANNQIDWTFPVKIKRNNKVIYKYRNPPPKTKALIKLIDKIKPSFLFPLHNSEFGGVYQYLSHPRPKLYPRFKSTILKNKFPLHLGAEETPFVKRLAPGIFLNFGLKEEINFNPQIIKKIKCGTNSSSYCKDNYQTFSVVTEIPLFWNGKVSDMTPTNIKYLKGVSMLADFNLSVVRFMNEEAKNIKDNFWRRYIKYWASVLEDDSKGMLKNAKEKRRTLSKAELFDFTVCKKWFAIKFAGSLIRAARLEGKKALERRLRKFISGLIEDTLKGEKIRFTKLKNALELQEKIIELVLSDC